MNSSEILEKIKLFIADLAEKHIANTEKLTLDELNSNPYLVNYLANYYLGNNNPESIAEVMILPRILGTSITTSFGTGFQKFLTDQNIVQGSMIQGIDIEFIDQIDGRKKYCQLKSGPNALNNDDVETYQSRFKSILNLSKTNNIQNLEPRDLILCLLYGPREKLNSFLRIFENSYQIYVQEEFWYHLTGDENFFNKIIEEFNKYAHKYDGQGVIRKTIHKLSKQIEGNL